MKVLLVHTPKKHQVWAGVPDIFNDKYAYLFPPLAVMGLSSYLKKHTEHDIRGMDCVVDDLDYPEIERQIREWKPDVIGVSSTSTHGLFNVVETVRAARRAHPGAFIVVGGPHANSFPENTARLPGIDAAITGDGERPMKALLDTLDSGGDIKDVPSILIQQEDGSIYRSEMADPIHDLDELPFPDREGFPPHKYFTPGMKGGRATTMYSSRGCPNQCIFCNVPHKYRARSPERVVDEIEECVRRYGIQDIHFIDDIFNITPERVMAISELILQRDLKIFWGYKASIRNTTREMVRLAKRAGCYKMHYGVEALTDKGLKALKKKSSVEEIFEIFRMTQDEGVKAIAYMIIGCPHEESPEELLEVARVMYRLNPAYVVYSLFTPYPDTGIFQKGADKGLFPRDCWEKWMVDPTEEYDLPTCWEEFMSKEEQLELFKTLHHKFYFHPRTLVKTFATLRTPSELKRVLLGGFQLARMQFLRHDTRSI